MILTVALSITLGLAASFQEDDVVGRSSSECFKKISVGERLIGYYVTRIVERDTVDGCEQECYIYKCTHFSFSVALKGKKICELSTDRQISRRQDSNFDLYEKTNECVQGKPTGYEEGAGSLVLALLIQVRRCDLRSAFQRLNVKTFNIISTTFTITAGSWQTNNIKSLWDLLLLILAFVSINKRL